MTLSSLVSQPYLPSGPPSPMSRSLFAVPPASRTRHNHLEHQSIPIRPLSNNQVLLKYGVVVRHILFH
jgi:hypothetical protein